MRTASSTMRLWTSLAALAIATPAFAQQGTIEVEPLEPLFAPGITQNDDGGGIVVRPVEPLISPDAPADGPVRSSPPDSEGDLLGEGFNDDAFGSGDQAAPEGEGSFIDRAFGTGRQPAEETVEGGLFPPEDQVVGDEETEDSTGWFDTADPPPEEENASEDGGWFGSADPLRDEDTSEDGGWFGSADPQPEEEGAGDSTGWFGSADPLPDEAEDDPSIALGDEDEDKPRFMPAPFTTRGLFGPSRPAALPRVATVPTEGAELRQLDKMTGATRTVTLRSGQEEEIGRLRVRLEGCHAPADGDTRGTVAFLRVWDPQQGSDPVFAGWMFADSPALSALDHPRYDLWVLGCTPPPAAADAEPADEPQPGEG